MKFTEISRAPTAIPTNLQITQFISIGDSKETVNLYGRCRFVEEEIEAQFT